MSLVFDTAKKRVAKKPIEFVLDGETYHFKPTKTTAIWLTATGTTDERMRAQLNWLSAGLPDKESDRLRERLMDFEDALEPLDLIRVVNQLMEEMSGRPTGPPPD